MELHLREVTWDMLAEEDPKLSWKMKKKLTPFKTKLT
jgi:hypothetical protein